MIPGFLADLFVSPLTIFLFLALTGFWIIGLFFIGISSPILSATDNIEEEKGICARSYMTLLYFTTLLTLYMTMRTTAPPPRKSVISKDNIGFIANLFSNMKKK